MYYKPNLGYKYPDKCDEHMITVKHVHDINVDENYKFINKSSFYKFKRGMLWLLLNLIIFPMCKLLYGTKYYGRKNLRKNKKLFKDGAITISNHVFMWDYLCVLKAIRPHLQFLPVWKTNFEGPSANCIKLIGGYPIPSDNYKAMKKFDEVTNDLLQDGKWYHVFPEGSMWYFYPDIRPLKKGVFKLAYKNNKPIIPITLSFRPRKGFYKLTGKCPCVDIHIGEPIILDTTKPMAEEVERVHKKAYHIMQVMNGINPGDPSYNINQNIEEYKKMKIINKI